VARVTALAAHVTFSSSADPPKAFPVTTNGALQPTPFELMTERGNFTRPGHHAFQLA